MNRISMSTRRQGLYFGALIVSFAVLVVGNLDGKNGVPVIPLLIAYISWIICFGLFLATFLENSPAFSVKALYYLVCIAAILCLLGTVSDVRLETLHLWVPVCSTVGVYIGTAIQDVGSLILARLQYHLLRLLGIEEPPTLPVFEPAPSQFNPRSPILSSPDALSESESSSDTASVPRASQRAIEYHQYRGDNPWTE